VNRHSHALKVAKLAGLPPSALKVAESVLEQLLKEKHSIQLDSDETGQSQHATQEPVVAANA
jgi:DNA mismatch repair ATPase MutS